jgi:hypothetical protein
MSPWTWCAVVLVAGVGVFPLLLALLGALLPLRAGEPGAAVSWAKVLTPCSVVALLTILYGQGSACPSCRKWWARTTAGTELVDRQVCDEGEVPVARSLYRTTYQCAACRHRWSVTQADEYRQQARPWLKQHRR